MIWDINPAILSIGSYELRYYALLFMVAFLLGYWFIAWVYKEERKDGAELDSLFTYMFLGTLIGARLGHVLFYEPSYYFSHPIEILKIWRGGLASHGAAIGILFSLYLFSKKHPATQFIWLCARISIAVSLAGFFIRLGNFFNSEIYGIPTDFFLGIVFARIDDLSRHPSQLYEAAACLGIFIFLFVYYLKNRAQANSYFILGFFFFTVFGMRFILEWTKDFQADFEATMLLHQGQILSIPLILLGAWLMWYGMRRYKV